MSAVAALSLGFPRGCAAAGWLGRVPGCWLTFHSSAGRVIAIGRRGALGRRRLRALGRRTCRLHRHVDLRRAKVCHFGRAHPL